MMKTCKFSFSLLFFLLCITISFAQETNREKQIAHIDSLNILANALIGTNPDLAVRQVEKAKSLSRQINYTKGLADCLNIEGHILRFKGAYPFAIEAFEKSLELRKVSFDAYGEAKTLNNLGIVYRQLDELGTALSYYEESLEIREKANDHKGVSIVKNNIGDLYLGLDSEKAHHHLLESLEALKGLGDPFAHREAIYPFISIGQLLLEKEQYQAALDTLEMGMVLSRKFDNTSKIAETYLYKGMAYQGLNDFDKASQLYEKAIGLTTDSIIHLDILIQKAKLAFEQENYSLASSNNERAKRLAKKLDLQERLFELYERIIGNYTILQNDSLVLATKQEYKEVRRAYKLQELSRDKEMFEHFKKKKELEKKAFEGELKSARQVKMQAIIIAVIFILISALLAGMYYRLMMSKQYIRLQEKEINSHLIMDMAAEHIERHVDTLITHQEAIIEAQNAVREAMALELHDDVNSDLAAIKMNLEYYLKKIPNIPQNIMEDVQLAINKIGEVMCRIRKITTETKADCQQEIDLVEHLQTTCEAFHTPDFLHVHFEAQTESKEIWVNNLLVRDSIRITKELFHNILKHAEATSVTVKVAKISSELSFSILDNGKGFYLEDIDQPELGNGIENIKTRVRKWNGTWQFDTKPGNGTFVTISFPLT